ncbi:MAG: hypothetical protein OXG78_10120 [Chloroflexi bacterium]|nr:hypothetical protein [Chloroflexota bacterium]
MFEDPELPDFDSMSQEELIEWLEQLAKRHSAASSEFIDDYTDSPEAADADAPSEDDDWSDWLDDTAPGAATVASDHAFMTDAGLGPADADPPVDLSLFEDEDTAPTASLDWLDEIVAAQQADELPDFKDLKAKPQSAGNPHNMPRGDDEDDPLDWLNELDTNGVALSGSGRAADGSDYDYPEDFDETWEDDETLDDLEDESLYSLDADASTSFLESLPALEDRETEEHSTQSMAPVPDSQPADTPETKETVAAAPADRADSLSKAFLVQEREADLEAWYAERLRAISAPEEAAALPEPIKPGKPPPGLKAAIFSARDKVKAENLPDALIDYETLLSTTAGLQWVVHDMRELIAQEKYRDMPSVHRVLGDAYMRQGHLDAALSVYRHALSLL